MNPRSRNRLRLRQHGSQMMVSQKSQSGFSRSRAAIACTMCREFVSRHTAQEIRKPGGELGVVDHRVARVAYPDEQ